MSGDWPSIEWLLERYEKMIQPTERGGYILSRQERLILEGVIHDLRKALEKS